MATSKSGNAFAGKRSTARPRFHILDRNLCGQAVPHALLVFREQVDFVEDFDARLGERIKLAENLFDLNLLLFAVGGGGVADVEKYLGLGNFFKRGAKAGDERVRQVANEADRIREENAATAGQLDGTQLGIERGEHARRGKHLRTSNGVEERAFAGVGVSDKGYGGHGNGFAALALLLAHTAHGIEVELELIDAALDLAAIGFELRFTGPAGADAAA